mmetsp:Transcript_13589/g.16182  ORF Transcript_13589/g.16182 Transcript_13589/m.16182 type:complete len:306 (-) Transcript_13589:181-1098(-)
MAFVFNGSEMSSPPPPSEYDSTHMLPPIPKAQLSPSKYDKNNDESNDKNDEEISMPKEFYADVDQFLSLTPPSLKSIMKKKSGGGSGAGGGSRDVGNLEQIKNERSKLRKNKSAPSTTSQPKVQNRRRNSAGAPKKGPSATFDYGLLDEAMKFTDTLKLGATNGETERPDRLAGGSPPRQGNPVQALRRRKEANTEEVQSRANSVLKSSKKNPAKNSSVYESQRSKSKAKSKSKRSSGGAGFDNSGKVDNGRLELDSMVENFEQGLEVSRLRAELAASQQRMQHSTSAITSAASEFYQKPPTNKR